MAIVKDLGVATAYAYAVAGGYEGTEAEFTEMLGQAGITLEQLENLKAVATTLTEGSEATASYADGVLTFGIPRGNTGATGPQGEKGDTGDTGNGIVSIAKTATVGKVDTYTITFTNGTTTTFEVTNGEVTPEQMQAAIEAALVDYAEADGTYPLMTAGMAQALETDDVVTESKPYLYRKTGADAVREYDEIVGGSVVVNQLVETTGKDGSASWDADTTSYFKVIKTINVPIVSGHKYLYSTYISRTISGNNGIGITFSNTVPLEIANGSPDGVVQTIAEASASRVNYEVTANNYTGKRGFNAGDSVSYDNLMIIDLTQMLGAAIADYAYSLEQATAGSGIAWLKSYGFFGDDYIPYNAGELRHVSGVEAHVMTGKNMFDPSLLKDQVAWNTFTLQLLPNTHYVMSGDTDANNMLLYFSKGGFSAGNQVYSGHPVYILTDADGLAYIQQRRAGGTASFADYHIQMEFGTTPTAYEPYTVNSYTLDDTVTLRGIPKLSGDQMYYDGDVYSADGSVSRRYALVDLGTLGWIASATEHCFYAHESGETNKIPYAIGSDVSMACTKYLFTGTRSAAPFFGDDKTIQAYVRPNANILSELYVKDTAYTDAATFKAAMSGVMLLYELATPTTETATPYQTPQICDPDGTEEYVGAVIPVGHNTRYPANLVGRLEKLPDIPTTAGTYNLQVTVASGKATAQWVSV